jgi:chemotaxis protein methyltransferase CheR
MMSGVPEELLDRISTYVSDRMGLHYPSERRGDLERGLRCAAPDLGFTDVASFARWLLATPLTRPQIEVLAACLTVGETYFFRDQTVFNLLENRLLPEMIHQRRSSGRRDLRIWSAGCATGEEPYSLAILLRRLIPDIEQWAITLLATDINPRFLARAQAGLYGKWSFRDVPSWVKSLYFQATAEGKFALSPDIRKSVMFAYHNLAEDAYPSIATHTNAMDIIFCRNVLMYFTQKRRHRVAEQLSRCLVPDGLLVVSPTEMSTVLAAHLTALPHAGAAIYRKRGEGGGRGGQETLRPEQPLSEKSRHPAAGSPLPEISMDRTRQNETAAQWQAHYQEAFRAYEKGRHDEAQAKLALLLDETPDRAPALALLSRIRASEGRLADARDLCAKAIAADKLTADYHYLLAMILLELDQEQEAVASFTHALYLDPEFVLAHFALGTILLRRGKTREARRHFENAQSSLRHYGAEEILPESEGITAGRMVELIEFTMNTATKASVPDG